jgi:hypothetical protein
MRCNESTDSLHGSGQKSGKCPMRCNESTDSLHGSGQKSEKCPMRCNESPDSLHDTGRNTAKMCCVCNACNESTDSLHGPAQKAENRHFRCNESTDSVQAQGKNPKTWEQPVWHENCPGLNVVTGHLGIQRKWTHMPRTLRLQETPSFAFPPRIANCPALSGKTLPGLPNHFFLPF